MKYTLVEQVERMKINLSLNKTCIETNDYPNIEQKAVFSPAVLKLHDERLSLLVLSLDVHSLLSSITIGLKELEVSINGKK